MRKFPLNFQYLTRFATLIPNLFSIMSIFNKNTLPNIVAIIIIAASFTVSGRIADILLSVGLFALSGAITNWLAVHMLFEKVPGLYGSGVIPLHFAEFKQAILQLLTEQLFKSENVERAFQRESTEDQAVLNFEPVIEGINFDGAYEQLVQTIMESSFGNMLAMLGGQEALDPLKEPFKKKMQQFLRDTAQSDAFQQALSSGLSKAASSDTFLQKIQEIAQQRLDEMTPEMVKDIVQTMIRKHLGWLVVWGGVFGGTLGLIIALLSST